MCVETRPDAGPRFYGHRVTEAVAAWSTFAAAAIALLLGGLAEWRSLKDRRANRDREALSQAQRVAAWVETRYAAHALRDEQMPTCRARLVVQNASGQPVWDVAVEYWETDAEGGDRGAFEWNLGVLPPEARREREVAWVVPEDDQPVPVQFRDNGDRLWLRDNGGSLKALPTQG